MERSYTEVNLDSYRREHQIADTRVRVYMDIENSEEILSIITQYMTRFQMILYWVLKGVKSYNDDFYGDESISGKTKGIYAMKFKTGKGQNFRIYCREFFNPAQTQKKVIMAFGYHKKSEDVDKKLKNILGSIAEYDYEITW